MTYEIRKIGTMRGIVINGRVRSNLFSNPFEFKMLETCANDLDIRRAVFQYYSSKFTVKKSERKLGFLRLFYETKQLGLIDNGILVITLRASDALDLEDMFKTQKEYALYKNVVKNKDIIMSICKANYHELLS
jgi:hypothetical protein